MTREEAARYFKRHIDLYCVTGICREAEEMAIKALEQVPCEDCISREQAIKQCGFGMTSLLIADNLRKLPPVQPKIKQEYCEDAISRAEALKAINKMDIPEDMSVFEIKSHMGVEIGTLPPVQPKTDVLDKIRAEIENYKLSEDELIEIDEDSVKWGMKIAYDIIGKYKAEVEPQESEKI